MYFHSFADFFAMGKHAPYVWSAYGITLLVLVIMHLYNRRQHRRLSQLLRNLKDKP